MSWKDAYEEQIDTWAFWQSEIGQRYARGYVNDKHTKGTAPVSVADELVRIESEKLLAADPIYVDPDMQMLWRAAAPDFEPEPFEASDLVAPAGFLYLPEPEMLLDVNGKRCSWRAFAWALTEVIYGDSGVRKPAISISLYSHWEDDDDYNPSLREEAKKNDKLAELARYRLSLMHMDHWLFGQSFEEATESHGSLSVRDQERARAGFRDTWQKIQALFRLMHQTISVPVLGQPPRATRRRGKRKGFDPETKVTIIRLRRPKRPRQSDEAREVDWTHRWPVSGHWRNQWYPSLGIHRQRYINPYIKGPDDKPLAIPKVRAFELIQ